MKMMKKIDPIGGWNVPQDKQLMMDLPGRNIELLLLFVLG